MIESSDFFEHQTLNKLVEQVTTMYAGIFCNNDKNQASGLLLPKRAAMPLDLFLLNLVSRMIGAERPQTCIC